MPRPGGHPSAAFPRPERGPAFRLALKSNPHGRLRQSPAGPERSEGPAQRVDGRGQPCAKGRALARALPNGGESFSCCRYHILATLGARTQQASTEKYDNILLLSNVTWTLMGHHGNTSKTERWSMRRVPRNADQTASHAQGLHATTPRPYDRLETAEDRCSRGAGDLDRETPYFLRPALT